MGATKFGEGTALECPPWLRAWIQVIKTSLCDTWLSHCQLKYRK